MPDRVLAKLQAEWDEEDQLRPDAPAGPRHGEGLVDLTGSDPWSIWIRFRLLTATRRRPYHPVQ